MVDRQDRRLGFHRTGELPNYAVLLGQQVDFSELILAESEIGAIRVHYFAQRLLLSAVNQRQFKERRGLAVRQLIDIGEEDPTRCYIAKEVLARFPGWNAVFPATILQRVDAKNLSQGTQ